MSDKDDPWTEWYQAYCAQRAGIMAARRLASDRRKAANVMAALLFAYMIFGGMVASIAVGLVMSH